MLCFYCYASNILFVTLSVVFNCNARDVLFVTLSVVFLLSCRVMFFIVILRVQILSLFCVSCFYCYADSTVFIVMLYGVFLLLC